MERDAVRVVEYAHGQTRVSAVLVLALVAGASGPPLALFVHQRAGELRAWVQPDVLRALVPVAWLVTHVVGWWLADFAYQQIVLHPDRWCGRRRAQIAKVLNAVWAALSGFILLMGRW